MLKTLLFSRLRMAFLTEKWPLEKIVNSLQMRDLKCDFYDSSDSRESLHGTAPEKSATKRFARMNRKDEYRSKY